MEDTNNKTLIGRTLYNYGYENTFVIDGSLLGNATFVGVSHGDNAVYLVNSEDDIPEYEEPKDKEMKLPIFIKKYVEGEMDDDTVILEPRGLTKAIVGMTFDGRAVYDYNMLVSAFMECENWKEEDAIEWVEYNTIRSLPYIPNSPIILYGLDFIF